MEREVRVHLCIRSVFGEGFFKYKRYIRYM